jgi:Fe-S cluster assembly protein SufD
MTGTIDFRKEFKERQAALPGSTAVAALRQQSLDDFLANGLPTAKTEGWRYADLNRISGKPLPLAPANSARFPQKSVSGWPLALTSRPKAALSRAVPGVFFTSSAALLAQKNEAGETLLLPAVSDHPFDQLNRAFAGDGFVLEVAPGAKVEGIEVLAASEGMDEGARYLRNAIRVGRDGSARIFLRTVSADNGGWLNTVTAIHLEEGARLTLIGDFDAPPSVLLSALLSVTLAKDATLSYRAFAGGVASLRHEVHARLEGDGASLDLSGALMAGTDEVVDFVTAITHTHGHAKSRQAIKAIAGAKGRTAFQGRIVVGEGAVKTDAKQECHNLLLDRGGEANVKPELLIFADDVACAHGASVGEVDASALFYLTQRGIPEGEARAMLVRAFLSDILEDIAHASIRAALEAKAEVWMKKNFGGEGRHE